MQGFLKLEIWQRAHRFRLVMFTLVKRFPAEERYDLTQQLRRASRSIATNIAESSGYTGNLDTARFLQMSIGSCCETLDHLISAVSHGYIQRDEYKTHAKELGQIRAMLIAFVREIRRRNR